MLLNVMLCKYYILLEHYNYASLFASNENMHSTDLIEHMLYLLSLDSIHISFQLKRKQN